MVNLSMYNTHKQIVNNKTKRSRLNYTNFEVMFVDDISSYVSDRMTNGRTTKLAQRV